MQLSTKILVGMSAGIIVGLLFNALGGSNPDESVLITWIVENIFDVIGKIFVVSLKLLVVPLVFFSLVCGSASMGEDIKMGQVAIKTILLYLLTTAIAVSIALLVANIVDPGVGINTGTIDSFEVKTAPSVKEVLIGISLTTLLGQWLMGTCCKSLFLQYWLASRF